MANIFDYLKWRGDLTVEQAEFNDVDSLILCRLSYIPFDDFEIPEKIENAITIFETAAKFLRSGKVEQYTANGDIMLQDDIKLLREAASCERFKHMKIFAYVNQIDMEDQKQFSALSICVSPNLTYISFKGTDNTLVGWKEDFNMCFKTPVPSQIDSVVYLEQIAAAANTKLWVGGHSKGGNLAVYASSFCRPDIQERILHISNNDGPGFDQSVLESPGYRNMLNKIRTYVPQTAIVGMLLLREESYTVIHSTQNGFFQHDVFSWEVEATGLVCLNEVTRESQYIDITLKAWLQGMTNEQRELFFDTLFRVITSTGAVKITDFSENRLMKARLFLTSLKNIDEPTRRMIRELMGALFKTARDNISHLTAPAAQSSPRLTSSVNQSQLKILEKYNKNI